MEPLSREFLLKRGHCCGNGCKNCPYTENEMAKLELPFDQFKAIEIKGMHFIVD